MTLTYNQKAIKQLKKLPLSEKKKVVRKLEQLADAPRVGKLLQGGYEGLRSLRAWPYRIIYIVKENSIIVYSIAHRQACTSEACSLFKERDSILPAH